AVGNYSKCSVPREAYLEVSSFNSGRILVLLAHSGADAGLVLNSKYEANDKDGYPPGPQPTEIP
ncbi:Hypothetical protein FKW44_006355, partial [Caligus rogercresseyi]